MAYGQICFGIPIGVYDAEELNRINKILSLNKNQENQYTTFNYGVDDELEYLLCIKNTFFLCDIFIPTKINLPRITKKDKKALLTFCEKHDITYLKNPGWYLTSYLKRCK